jgi:hypothetical protein
MDFLYSQEFWLSLAVMAAGGGAIWAAFKFGKSLTDRELGYWFHEILLIHFDKNSSPADRQQALQELSEIYRGYLRERNDFWDKYGQILVAVVIITLLTVLLLTKTISPESGLPILSGVGGYAIAKSSSLSTTNRPRRGPPEQG